LLRGYGIRLPREARKRRKKRRLKRRTIGRKTVIEVIKTII
jgi:hypothetical protein